MKRKELVEKAKYIQFPYINKRYHKYYDKRNPVKVPLAGGYDPLYSLTSNDKHHYTTYFHRRNVLPLLEKLLKFGYRQSDFTVVKNLHKEGDYSYMTPKTSMKFDLYRYDVEKPVIERDVDFRNLLSMKELTTHGESPHRYWGLYRYPHACSRIINKSLPRDGRKLFISGDSQMIPDIAVLACYFREVWYFDNRTGYKTGPRDEKGNYDIKWVKENHISCSRFYENKEFTDVLIQTYCAGLERYEKWNIY